MSKVQYSGQKRHLFYDEPKPFNNNQLQIVKLFDAFFLANHHAAKENQFLTNNKITLIVNLAPQEIHTNSNITVLNYDFYHRKNQAEEKFNIFPILQIIAKIEYCLHTKCEGIAIIHKNIESKVISFGVIYLMIKYRWDLSQAFGFVQNKRPNAQIGHKQLQVLQKFSRNSERYKLSEVFDTQQTNIEEELLQNTAKNSHTINMPNFHGLDFQKTQNLTTISKQAVIKKVKFAKKIEQIISKDNKPDAVFASPKLSTKFTNAERKLRQFIKQKCKTTDQEEIKVQKGDEIIQIRSKQIMYRAPKKRTVSKTQQSPITSKQKKIQQNNFLSIQFKQQDSLIRKEQHLKTYIPSLEMKVRILEKLNTQAEQDETQSQRRDKRYIIHNNKRYHMPKKCYTDQSILNNYNHTHQKKEPQKKKQAANNFMFKITKSNKNSYKKFKINSSVIKQALGKQSEKCIKIIDQDEGRKQTSLNSLAYEQINNNGKVINLNLNVQIDNISLIHQRPLREGKEEQPYKFNRPYHPKKISRISYHQNIDQE